MQLGVVTIMIAPACLFVVKGDSSAVEEALHPGYLMQANLLRERLPSLI